MFDKKYCRVVYKRTIVIVVYAFYVWVFGAYSWSSAMISDLLLWDNNGNIATLIKHIFELEGHPGENSLQAQKQRHPCSTFRREIGLFGNFFETE